MNRQISICIFLFITTSTNHVFSQIDTPFKDTLVSYKFMCFDNLSIEIPSGIHKIQKDSYEEGFILLIAYADTSYISILCGGNATLNIKAARMKNLYARKEIIEGRQIIYENVPVERKAIFDLAFDRLKENGLNTGN